MEPRISLITLGVEDLERAVAFYERMGLVRHKRFTEGVAFFQLGGLILSLWPRENLAEDAGLDQGFAAYRSTASNAPFSGVALAYNTRDVAEVADVLNRAESAGGRVVTQARRAEWGGTQGYFFDTENNLWEVAYNPDFSIDAEGRITLPD